MRFYEMSKKRTKEKIRIAHEFRKKLIKGATPHEKRFKAFLDSKGLNYRFQKILYTRESFYIIDFYFPNIRICVELDGYYHFTPTGIKKDKRRNAVLQATGFRTIRFHNWQIDRDMLGVINTLRKVGIMQ